MPVDLDCARYVSLTTYKKNGDPVSLAVWIVQCDDGYAFTTDIDSFKVRRIKNDSRATLAVCDRRGKVAAGTVVHCGQAELLGALDTKRVEKLVRQKYRIGTAVLGVASLVRSLWPACHKSASGAILVTLAK